MKAKEKTNMGHAFICEHCDCYHTVTDGCNEAWVEACRSKKAARRAWEGCVTVERTSWEAWKEPGSGVTQAIAWFEACEAKRQAWRTWKAARDVEYATWRKLT